MMSILSRIQMSNVQPPQLYTYIVLSLEQLSCTLPAKNVLYIIERAYARVRVPSKRHTHKYRPRLFQFLHIVSAQYTGQAPSIVKLRVYAHGRLPGTLRYIRMFFLLVEVGCQRLPPSGGVMSRRWFLTVHWVRVVHSRALVAPVRVAGLHSGFRSWGSEITIHAYQRGQNAKIYAKGYRHQYLKGENVWQGGCVWRGVPPIPTPPP